LSGLDVIRPYGRLLWGAGIASVVVSLWAAPALVWAQAGGGDPGKTDQREQTVEEEAAEADVAWEDKPYTVVDGKVDLGTYNGYRRYHSSCHVCHGPDALGSSYAPALLESIPQIGYEGYRKLRRLAASDRHVIPGHDPRVLAEYPAASAQTEHWVARLDLDPRD
jgi:hypothetical protein